MTTLNNHWTNVIRTRQCDLESPKKADQYFQSFSIQSPSYKSELRDGTRSSIIWWSVLGTCFISFHRSKLGLCKRCYNCSRCNSGRRCDDQAIVCLPTKGQKVIVLVSYNITKNNFKITAFECNFWAIHTVQHHVTQCLFPPRSFHLHLRNSFRWSIGIFLWFLAEFGRKWSLEENIDKVRKKGLTYQTGNKLLEERVLRVLIYWDYIETNWECCTGV